MRRAIPLILLLALATGCLEKNRTHRMYLEPDGSATWTVLEDDVRSTGGSPDERASEERAFLREARGRGYVVGRALRELGGGPVRTTILRDEAPMAIWTEAEFASAADALAALFNGVGAQSSSLFLSEGDRRTVELLIAGTDENEASDTDTDTADIIWELFPDEDHFHIVLTVGKVVDAIGFDVSQDGRTATMILDEERLTRDETGRFIFRVVWRVPDAPF